MQTSQPSFAHPRTDSHTHPLDVATRIAPRALGHAILVGIAADTVLRDGIDGAGFPVWVALLVLAFISLTWRAEREVTSEASMWLCVATFSACGLAWRDADTLKVLDFLATAGGLAMAAIALGNPRAGILAERFRDSLWAALASVRVVAWGLVPNLGAVVRESQGKPAWQSGTRRTLRSALLGFGVVALFGSLLRSADPIFASLMALPDFDPGVAFSHLFFAIVVAWIVTGWANAALGSTVASAVAPNRLPFSLDIGDLTSSLGVLIALFAVFMFAQLGWLFGGESFLRARTGLTAAEYARSGFFEMIWVVVLVIPLLVITRAALVPGRASARRHTLLAVPLIALLGGIIASAAARMQLYVHYYGLTVDRLYPLIFMGWLTFVLVWLGATVLRNRGQRFIAGCAASAYLVLVGINVAAPDAVVARFNEQRADGRSDRRASADLRHLSELSAEAVDVAIRNTLAAPTAAAGSSDRITADGARCDAARTLVDRWGSASRAAWRSQEPDAWTDWNAGERHAIALVRANAVPLRDVLHASCAGGSDRSKRALARR